MHELGAHGAGPCHGLLPPGAHLLDGMIALADDGRGGRSLLVLRGPSAGEVWSDWTGAGGAIAPEARGFDAWYQQWLDRALLEWLEGAAPLIALEGPSDPAELEAIAIGFELLERWAGGGPRLLRTLGYLHLREHRWGDADAAFTAAAAADHDEPAPRLALDRARSRSCAMLPRTRSRWRAAGSLALHHRLARERLASNNLGGAGAALERAAQMPHLLGGLAPFAVRVAASFDPIIAELRAAGRTVDAEALGSRATLILEAN